MLKLLIVCFKLSNAKNIVGADVGIRPYVDFQLSIDKIKSCRELWGKAEWYFRHQPQALHLLYFLTNHFRNSIPRLQYLQNRQCHQWA